MSANDSLPIIQGPALDYTNPSIIQGPQEFPSYVILRDPGRALFVKLEGQSALFGHLDGPGHLPRQWRPIPHNPVGEWSTNPTTGLLVFTHKRGTFEEQKGREFWREIQGGETFYIYERIE